MVDIELAKRLQMQCARCPALVSERSQVVLPQGPVPCDLMLVGEAPGRKEDRTGAPFQGPSGVMLDRWLNHLHLRREEIFITNTAMCKPPYRAPTAVEVDNCADHLLFWLRVVKPRLTITVGRVAHDQLLKLQRQVEFEFDIVHLYHPAYFMRRGMSVESTFPYLTRVAEALLDVSRSD